MIRRIALYVSVIFSACSLIAEIAVFPGEWEEKGGVKKLFDTPLGALYRFDDSKSYELIATPNPEHKDQCDCAICRKRKNPPNMGGGLLRFGFLKNSKRNWRYVVIDFKIRAFPALDKKEGAQFRFFLTRSEKNKISADYGDLNGLAEVASPPGPLRFFSTGHWKSFDDDESISPYLFVLTPMFEPIAYRFIFDTMSGVLDVYQNGVLVSSHRHEIPMIGHAPIEIRNFGIITQNDGKSRNYREEYLEISNPVVRMASSKKELMEEAPPAGFSPYPYGNYYSMVKDDQPDRLLREIRNHKNPDLQYAWALRLLYGSNPDPAEALELLERAAKEKHVPALYQLGVCYFRGYGVEPDLKKAIDYMEDAAKYQYSPALILHGWMQWDALKRPWFIPDFLKKIYPYSLKPLNKIGLRTRLNTGNDIDFDVSDHDTGSFLGAFLDIGHREHWLISFKYLHSIDTIFHVLSADPRKNDLLFVDYAIASGYCPAHYELIKYILAFPEWNSKPRKISKEEMYLHLNAGVKAGDPAALPGLLLMKARDGKLSPADFTKLDELKYSDHPLWLFLKFVAENPQYPGMREYLKQTTLAPWEIRKENPPATEAMLFGLLKLCHWVVLTDGSRSHQDSVAISFESLLEAADSGPIAQCWLGQLYYNGDLPQSERQRGEFYHRQKAQQYFEAAAKGGMLKAKFMLLVLESESVGLRVDDLLKKLTEFCDLNYAPAWMLRGKVLRNASRHDEAKEAYRRAAELGEHHGLQELALYAEREKNKEDANHFWGEYIQADRRYRMFDRFDPFWPDIYGELGKWKYGAVSGDAAELAASTEMIGEGEAGGEELKEPEQPEEEEKPHPLFDKKKKKSEPEPRKTKILNP